MFIFITVDELFSQGLSMSLYIILPITVRSLVLFLEPIFDTIILCTIRIVLWIKNILLIDWLIVFPLLNTTPTQIILVDSFPLLWWQLIVIGFRSHYSMYVINVLRILNTEFNWRACPEEPLAKERKITIYPEKSKQCAGWARETAWRGRQGQPSHDSCSI